ncbi:response regulator [Flavobacterium akiainvivens]|uniref:response regulator n=1 Tax=Flavobacterium akiainvivens TaxID=1202724 RepID=UPI0008E1082A|nr:response regulator [Flavobacterium akiainvivens]SFQ72770.1 DNA-binding response regulator, NarL/FixJ family, contains REC and HTH domains [Flavobacterium akiainvivens]
MAKQLRVLAIDDHVAVLEGYHYMFMNLDDSYGIPHFEKAHDCKSGHGLISAHKGSSFDIALIDYSIPRFEEEKMYTGQDLAMLVRKTMPSCKIVMMTMHKEIDIIAGILDSVKPEGFINKSDCNTDELLEAFKKVLDGETFYSRAVENYFKRRNKGVVLEDIDVRIILLLAKGIKNKNLENYIPLSGSAIEKRKYNIKRILEVKGDDEDLINEARNQGFI